MAIVQVSRWKGSFANIGVARDVAPLLKKHGLDPEFYLGALDPNGIMPWAMVATGVPEWYLKQEFGRARGIAGQDVRGQDFEGAARNGRTGKSGEGFSVVGLEREAGRDDLRILVLAARSRHHAAAELAPSNRRVLATL